MSCKSSASNSPRGLRRSRRLVGDAAQRSGYRICEASRDLELSPVGSKIGSKERERVIRQARNVCVEIRGAPQNNPKGIAVDLPVGKLTVIPGPSGRGKSRLAFETI